MSDEEVGEVRCTPAGPGLEFGLFEAVRLRLVEALTRRDYDPSTPRETPSASCRAYAFKAPG